MAAHTYWRINFTEKGGGTFIAIAEIEMRGAIGSADQCSGGTAIGNLATGSFVAANAFDNSNSTLARSSSTLPLWLGYQFLSPVDVAQFTIQVASDAVTALSYPSEFSLQYSDDGSTWTSVDTINGITNWANSEVKAFTVGAASINRLEGEIVAVARQVVPTSLNLQALSVQVLRSSIGVDAPTTVRPQVFTST